jgi:hypothetical protein
MTTYWETLGAERMSEAVHSGECLHDVLLHFFNEGCCFPELSSGAIGILLACHVSAKESGLTFSSPDPVVQSFLEYPPVRMRVDLVLAFNDEDPSRFRLLANGLASSVEASREVNAKFSFVINPKQDATQAINIHNTVQPAPVVVQNDVHPAPVTVNNAFASKATQTVERDASDEIVSTVTIYQ